ncbi:MAG: ribosome biogenesis GTP-binding protein YihA/YsxC [Bacilli bacterium]|nr:ribosome biogenesis GTP-binding protein YihA/YsxC [Bacilli bacterium]
MINFSKVKFVKSAPTFTDRPDKSLKEVVFVGKSNVGKSSLINALVKNKKMAFTSSKPGYTKLLNYFEIDEKFYLVDAPGYGYTASGSKHLDNFSKMMETYFDNPSLAGVVFIVDSRHNMSCDDVAFYDFIVEKGIPFILVASKADKLNQSEKAKIKKHIQNEMGIENFILASSTSGIGLEEIKAKISQIL